MTLILFKEDCFSRNLSSKVCSFLHIFAIHSRIFLDLIFYEIVFVLYDSSIWKSNQLKLDSLRKWPTIGTFTRQFESTGCFENTAMIVMFDYRTLVLRLTFITVDFI
ncbi:unnamed protein product [Spodoptera littoralis]|uniref:Uncharacterized protein n=1 Tax=Spodoptera littoralis TaxID=7109 RepID=A0A9P0HZ53_SPOLI|nr:unnamed protein product [Spodoptera littoralis]CAH1637223.1 unnamed protein product [Spodoptera littoralis]